MKRVLSILFLLTVFSAASAAAETELVVAVYRLTGMHCEGCARNIEQALKKLEGVSEVEVFFSEKRAEVTHHPERITPAQVEEAIEKLGYNAEVASDPPSEASPEGDEQVPLSTTDSR